MPITSQELQKNTGKKHGYSMRIWRYFWGLFSYLLLSLISVFLFSSGWSTLANSMIAFVIFAIIFVFVLVFVIIKRIRGARKINVSLSGVVSLIVVQGLVLISLPADCGDFTCKTGLPIIFQFFHSEVVNSLIISIKEHISFSFSLLITFIYTCLLLFLVFKSLFSKNES